MNREFIPYELALELKQLGFNEPCLASYYHAGRKLDICEYINHGEYTVLAPTFSQAFKFFREKHQLIHYISWVYKKTYDGVDWFFRIKGINMANNNVMPHDETRFGTYEEAEVACLIKLIEIIKNKN